LTHITTSVLTMTCSINLHYGCYIQLWFNWATFPSRGKEPFVYSNTRAPYSEELPRLWNDLLCVKWDVKLTHSLI